MQINNIPITLTLIRLVVSPIVLPPLLIYILPYNNIFLNSILSLLFVALSLTDFFDGYLARKYGAETALGTVLDPIADKFLVFSALIALLVVKKIFFFWVVLLIGREFFMMGLRQIALEYNFTIRVSAMGKLKTMLQMTFITLAIFNPYQAVGLGLQMPALWNTIELILLMLTLGTSLLSAWKYYQLFIQELQKKTMMHKEV